MRAPELVISTEPAPDEFQYLEDRLYEFNSTATGISDGEWLAIFVRDDNHRIVAGLCGNTWAQAANPAVDRTAGSPRPVTTTDLGSVQRAPHVVLIRL